MSQPRSHLQKVGQVVLLLHLNPPPRFLGCRRPRRRRALANWRLLAGAGARRWGLLLQGVNLRHEGIQRIHLESRPAA